MVASLNDWGYVEVRLSRENVEMPDLKHFLEINAWRLGPGREAHSRQYWTYWMPRIFARYLIRYADVMEETYRYHNPQWAAFYLHVARRTYNHLHEVSPVNAATDPSVWRCCG